VRVELDIAAKEGVEEKPLRTFSHSTVLRIRTSMCSFDAKFRSCFRLTQIKAIHVRANKCGVAKLCQRRNHRPGTADHAMFYGTAARVYKI
jgi:hypothetical protein